MQDQPGRGSTEYPRRSRSRTRQESFLGLARVLALIGGLSAAAIGLALGGLFSIATLFQGEDTLVTAITFSLSIVLIAVGLGLGVAWQAFQAIRGQPSRPFHPPKVWPLALVFLLAIAAGQLILSLHFLPVATFPPFHILAATLPALIILALAGRALAGVTRWRDIILQLGAGALISTPLALVLEAILVVVLALLAIFGVSLRPGGPELLERLAQLLQSAPPMEDAEAMLPVLLSPAVIAGVTAVVAGAVPLIEESIKTIGVPLLAYRRPGMAAALLWGLAGGAGFALVEGLLNTAGGLQGWAMVILVRVGATLLHCVTGALMGLAWYWGLLRQRWWQALGLYGGSVAVHSFWNVLSVGIAFLSAGAGAPEAAAPVPVLAGLSLGLMLALVGTTLVLALGLAGLVYYVRHQDQAAGIPPAKPSSAPPQGSQPTPVLAAVPGSLMPHLSQGVSVALAKNEGQTQGMEEETNDQAT